MCYRCLNIFSNSENTASFISMLQMSKYFCPCSRDLRTIRNDTSMLTKRLKVHATDKIDC